MRPVVLLTLLLVCAAVPLSAAPSLMGDPGLILIPSADHAIFGDYVVGANSVDEAYRPYYNEPHATLLHYYNVVVAPRIDVTLGLVNFDNRLGVQWFGPERPIAPSPDGKPAGGWNVDRVLSGRWLVWPNKGHVPGLAVGWRDVGGTENYAAKYAVLTRRFPSKPRPDRPGWGIHLGVGTGTLQGVFGGLDFWPTRRLGLLLETADGRTNVGAHIKLTNQLILQPSLVDLRTLSGGIVYTNAMGFGP